MASRTCRWYNSVRACTGFNISTQFKMEKTKATKSLPVESTIYKRWYFLHLLSTSNILMPKSLSSKSPSTNCLARKSKILYQLSSILLQAPPLSAVSIEFSKVLFHLFILIPCIDMYGIFEAQTKGYWWWRWTPCKEKDIGSTQWHVLTQGMYFIKYISLVISEQH